MKLITNNDELRKYIPGSYALEGILELTDDFDDFVIDVVDHLLYYDGRFRRLDLLEKVSRSEEHTSELQSPVWIS